MLTNLYENKKIKTVDINPKESSNLTSIHGSGKFKAMKILGEPKKNGPLVIGVTLEGEPLRKTSSPKFRGFNRTGAQRDKRANIFSMVTNFSNLKSFFDQRYKILDAWIIEY